MIPKTIGSNTFLDKADLISLCSIEGKDKKKKKY